MSPTARKENKKGTYEVETRETCHPALTIPDMAVEAPDVAVEALDDPSCPRQQR